MGIGNQNEEKKGNLNKTEKGENVIKGEKDEMKMKWKECHFLWIGDSK